MFTTFTVLALAGGALRLVLHWQLKKRWDISLAVPRVLAGALVVLAGWSAQRWVALLLCCSSTGAPKWWQEKQPSPLSGATSGKTQHRHLNCSSSWCSGSLIPSPNNINKVSPGLWPGSLTTYPRAAHYEWSFFLF